MPQTIRILIVEDRDVDAEIMLRELRRAGFDPAWTRVQTEDEYVRHLNSELDLILSDFELPRFTGRRALEILQELRLRVPFIVLSGTIGEDTAVAMMRQGATDYLLKDRLTRLGEAVRRALQEVEEREARERAESALRASDERFRKVFEYAPTGIAIGDAEWRIQRCNPAYCALVGVREEDVVGTPVIARVHPDDRATEEAELQRLRDARLPFVELQNRNLRSDGHVRWLHKFVSILHGDAGDPGHVLVLVTDTTERHQAEELMRESKAAAEAANRRKDLFIAMLSHELRTPLSPVVLALGTLHRRPDLPADVRDELAMMEENIALEVRLIDQLLDISRINSGKFNLNLQPIDLNAAVSDVCGICQAQLADRALTFEIDLAPDLAPVNADPAGIRQVLWNLISNAIKFTPDGGTIRVASRQLSDGQSEVRIADTGIGIEPEVMAHLFRPFEQADKRMTRPRGGLGLGLAISRAVVEQHGGRIRAESEGTGRGSVFTFVLPSSRPSLAEDVQQTPHPMRRAAALDLLVVEDHAPTAQALRALLARSGHRVTITRSVAEALREAREHRFDLVVSDIGLPDGDGCELMARLRELHPISGIAISGFGMAEDIQRSREAGFDAHLVKPVRGQQLLAAIGDVWERMRQRGGAPDKPRE